MNHMMRICSILLRVVAVLSLVLFLSLLPGSSMSNAAGAGSARLSVTSTPEGAEGWINGENTGFITPHTFDGMRPGTYKVEVRMRDYRPEARSISLDPGDDRSISFYPAIRSHIFILGIIPALLTGALMTLLLTVIAVGDGIIIGTLVGIGRVVHNRISRAICGAYVDFFRGTPLLVQIFMIHFGLPPILGRLLNRPEPVPLDPFFSAILALSINSGAYVAEIVRAGIQSIDRGQMEAARSLGMTYGQAMRLVILPQAMKRIIPPLGNEFIAMLKDSSLVSIIGMEELVRKGQIIVTRSYRPEDTWFTVGVVFLFMTLPFTRLVAYLERRLRTGDQA